MLHPSGEATDPDDALPPAVLLAGPTASGKTALAFELFDRFPLELVSVDSAQVFRDMNVGTAKPDAATLARYPHHLIDVITPEQAYSAGQFRHDARRVMADITARGKVPLLVGGTMLYYKVLLDGIADLPKADPALRQAIADEAARRGWPALHAELAALDPAAATRIDPNHSQRIQRALELVRLTGRPLDALFADAASNTAPAYRTLNLALYPEDRAVLHQRIGQRFTQMLDGGLVDEVRALRAKYALSPNMTSMRCVGYRQAWDFLDGALSLPQLIDQGIAATRQLAKRQITWLRSLPFTRLDPLSPALTATACQLLETHLCRGEYRSDSPASQKNSGNATLPLPTRSTLTFAAP